jgi:hypothetical protein
VHRLAGPDLGSRTAAAGATVSTSDQTHAAHSTVPSEAVARTGMRPSVCFPRPCDPASARSAGCTRVVAQTSCAEDREIVCGQSTARASPTWMPWAESSRQLARGRTRSCAVPGWLGSLGARGCSQWGSRSPTDTGNEGHTDRHTRRRTCSRTLALTDTMAQSNVSMSDESRSRRFRKFVQDDLPHANSKLQEEHHKTNSTALRSRIMT